MKNSDTQLIHRVLNGDENAFSALVEKYQRQVHALAWRKIGDFHIAEEITQDTFLKAYQKLRTLKKPQRFASWLYVIATNRCNTWLHKKRFRMQLLKNKGGARPEKPSYSEYVVEENERVSVEVQREVVKKLLAKLEESERTVMTLHYIAEMSCTEIGAFLGVSPNTIKSRLRRAQQRLKKEEPIIREALENFQISPNLTDTIMREVSRVKPDAPSGGKPLAPWAIAASTLTLAVVFLMFGFGNHQYLGLFQKPYSFDAPSEMTIDIIDTPIIANLESKIDVRTQIGSANAVGKRNNPEQQLNDPPAAIAETQAEETVKNYTKWELPEKAKARLGKGGINDMQFSPDGAQLAVGSNTGIWFYDVKTGKEVSKFPGMCQFLAFSPDGRSLASGRSSGNGGLWIIATGQKVALTDALPPTSALRFSEDGKTLLSLERWGDSISQLDITTGKGNRKQIKDITRRTFTLPVIHALTYDKFAVGGQDGEIELWDTTGQKLSTLSGHEGRHVYALAFSPDGTQLASGGADTTVHLWDVSSNDEPTILHQHGSWVNALAFSPNGKILASGSTDKTVQLWDTATGKPLTTFTDHIDGISALVFSPDGATLASASTDGIVRFWNINTSAALPTHITGHTRLIKTVAFLKNSTTLVSVTFNGVITLWDLQTSQKTDSQMHQVRGSGFPPLPQDVLHALAFSPDGTQLASIGSEGHVLFETGSGIISTAYYGGERLIRLIDVSTGRELQSLTGANDSDSVAFSPDGKTVAFGSKGRIRMWNTETDEHFDISLLNSNDANAEICALAFSPDGKKIVSGTIGRKIQMWDAETGAALTSLIAQNPNQELIGALAFSSNGEMLAVRNYGPGIRVMENSKLTRLREGRFGDGNCETLVFVPDSALLVIGLSNGKIELWDVESADKLITLDGHSEPVRTLVFSPDGKTLASTGQAGTILLWDWEEVLNGAEEKK
ncbi:sigma-70 family RNA polymerase sigma factor [Candidatus Poribacteria bacterium]|nr:sigma-70 family RNA polymerase sigma factor [Candidatus Poribacteria bacterium]